MKAYIAGALSQLKNKEKKQFYERIAEVCRACAIEPYLPHLKTDPIETPLLRPKEVYEWNYNQIKNSDFLIAYIGEPSLGVGTELEIAKREDVQVIALYEKDTIVSRMARGNPAVIYTIEYTDEEKALYELKNFLYHRSHKCTIMRIVRIDKALPLPQYHTNGSVAFDLYARTDATIMPRKIGLIPANVVIETPPEYMLVVVPRSSTPKRYGLLIPQGIGIVDQDFCGPEDELQLQFYNFTDEPVMIQRGTRLAQAVLVKIALAEFEEIHEITPRSRGGFGSTG